LMKDGSVPTRGCHMKKMHGDMQTYLLNKQSKAEHNRERGTNSRHGMGSIEAHAMDDYTQPTDEKMVLRTLSRRRAKRNRNKRTKSIQCESETTTQLLIESLDIMIISPTHSVAKHIIHIALHTEGEPHRPPPNSSLPISPKYISKYILRSLPHSTSILIPAHRGHLPSPSDGA